MARKRRILKRNLIGFAVLFLIICVSTLSYGNPRIVRHPPVAVFMRGALTTLPSYNPKSDDNWQLDMRGRDLTKLDLADRFADLQYSDFDTKTKWPATLPVSFKPDLIMQMAKNPGLGIRSLHQKGITGKGVGIAIIDQCLLVDHIEYKDRLKVYEEIHLVGEKNAQMHGPAVASIAVGKTVGVAPESDLYYIAESHIDFAKLIKLRKESQLRWIMSLGFKSEDNSKLTWKAIDFTWLAKSVERILEINKTLPKEKKIRVISISVGWSPGDTGYAEMMQAVSNAKQQGVFIVSSSLRRTHGLFFHGLGRDISKNADNASSYEPGSWGAKGFYEGKPYGNQNLENKERLLVPMDSRCVASPTGNEDYVFYRQGGWSWSIPYIAGLYALACQVKPNVTPDEFWAVALKTGVTTEIEKDGRKYKLGKIVNPEKLIEELQNKQDHSIHP